MLKSTSSAGFGLYILYSGGRGARAFHEIFSKPDEKVYSVPGKWDFIWDLIFLAIVSVFLFSTVKTMLHLILSGDYKEGSGSHIIIYAAVAIYYEVLFRITGNLISRRAVLILLPLLVLSGASLILGGFWSKTDLIMGFLSLVLTAIISFKRACLELANILRQE